MSHTKDIKDTVRAKYARAATSVAGTSQKSCCGSEDATQSCTPITANLYNDTETADLPEHVLRLSLGCGNPTALAQLQLGETVLDLGSGGGIDVLLSARRVGPNGKAYGLDMTDEMLELARRNQRQTGVENAEFLKGEMEDIPLPAASVDVVISNCVINLSADKRRVLAEAFRVLKPGGRFAVSDIVVRGDIPVEIRQNLELWAGCIAGALHEEEYRRLLLEEGFEQPEIEPTRIYHAEDARAFLMDAGLDADALAPQIEGRFASAFVRARKPTT